MKRLQDWLEGSEYAEPIIVLANREPFRHDLAPDGGIVVRHSTSGLVTAVEPLVQACSGVWVAHGAGTADRAVVDRRDGLDVPPANPRYRLRRVWLSEEEERGYYQGFANEALWPLCHRAHVQPTFRASDFRAYAAVNAKFADAAFAEARSGAPTVLVHDYHFALAPRMVRERLPLSAIVAFWHIPWPLPRVFQACPWGRELLSGLLGSDIVGFQTMADCFNFVETAASCLGASVNRALNVVTHAGRRTLVRAYPVSVEWPSRWARQSPPGPVCRQQICRQLQLPPDVLMGVGVDRLDYTKGLDEKVLAIGRLLESNPEFRERFVFVQIAELSRDMLPAYRALRSRVLLTVDRINRRFGSGAYRPIVLIEGHHEPAEVYRYLRAADLCYVGSLHDGMNLVSKEFVSARDDERGVLVLSRFAGAAQELSGALIVNPYAFDDTARTLAEALTMSDEEQARRMREMRSVVARSNSHWWAGQMLQDAARVSSATRARSGMDRSSRPSPTSAAPGLRAAL